MLGMARSRARAVALSVSVVLGGAVCFIIAAPSPETSVSGTNCTFRRDPDAFLSAQGRILSAVHQRTKLAGKARAEAAVPTDPTQMPRRNFIDDEIFGRLATEGVAAAPLSTDEEFLRRVTLDLTGRVPSPQQIRDFVANTASDKRDQLIETLLASPEFVDKWTMWMGDLLQNVAATPSTSSAFPQIGGRNAFFNYIKAAVGNGKSFRDIAIDCISMANTQPPTPPISQTYYDYTTYDNHFGPTNFMLTTATAMGPVQDTYDTGLYKSATVFMGMSHYDCLLCHSGRGHLDQLSLWGKYTTRMQAEQMAAFFSRTRIARQAIPAGTTNTNDYPWHVYNLTTGSYDLNTTYGNRPNRAPYTDANGNPLKTLTPVWQSTGATPAANANWRLEFANNLVNDPMFARNFANRLWKQMFGLGLVDPVDTLDPARLDPNNPPDAPWTLQATHPMLLEKLAKQAATDNFDLRAFLRLLVQSNAYQMSSRYDGDWSLNYVPLFARHYPRRLDGEEVHDQIQAATGIVNKYPVQGWGDYLVSWAMQLPEPVEPRSNGTGNVGSGLNFMSPFLRGNRDTQKRAQDGSILQQLNLMNDTFVVSRVKIAASPKLQAINKMTDSGQIADELFLTFLGRFPSDDEKAKVQTLLSKATTTQARTDAIQDTAWALVNKIDFLFSY